MSIRTLRTDYFVGIHRCPENGSQYTCRLIVEHTHGDLTLIDEFFEWVGKIIVVITEFCLFCLTVREGTHFYIESSGGGLPGICRTAPVADKSAVKLPFTFQDAIEQFIVMAHVYMIPQRDKLQGKLSKATFRKKIWEILSI